MEWSEKYFSGDEADVDGQGDGDGDNVPLRDSNNQDVRKDNSNWSACGDNEVLFADMNGVQHKIPCKKVHDDNIEKVKEKTVKKIKEKSNKSLCEKLMDMENNGVEL